MTIEHGEQLVFIKSNLGLSGEADDEKGTDDDEEPMVQLPADNTFDLAFNLTDKFMPLHDEELSWVCRQKALETEAGIEDELGEAGAQPRAAPRRVGGADGR
jgi:hypothetical protein